MARVKYGDLVRTVRIGGWRLSTIRVYSLDRTDYEDTLLSKRSVFRAVSVTEQIEAEGDTIDLAIDNFLTKYISQIKEAKD